MPLSLQTSYSTLVITGSGFEDEKKHLLIKINASLIPSKTRITYLCNGILATIIRNKMQDSDEPGAKDLILQKIYPSRELTAL
jgi:hypothetical protein